MKPLLILTLLLTVAGCEFKIERMPNGETTSVKDNCANHPCLSIQPEEPFIGEVYCKDCNPPMWSEFTENKLLDKHAEEIKVYVCIEKSDDPHTLTVCQGEWFKYYFFYSDIPDQYQSKRDEIEKQVFKQSIIDSGVAFMDMEGNYKPNLGRVDPPEETENMVTYTGTMNYDWNETWSYCQDFILTNPHEYTFEIKNGQLEARCKE